MVWFGFFVCRHIDFSVLFNAKIILGEDQQTAILTMAGGLRWFNIFFMGIRPKERNVFDQHQDMFNIAFKFNV